MPAGYEPAPLLYVYLYFTDIISFPGLAESSFAEIIIEQSKFFFNSSADIGEPDAAGAAAYAAECLFAKA